MDTKDTTARGRHATPVAERIFTVESANEALVFVRKVVKDAVGAYEELMRLRTERQGLALASDASEQLVDLRIQIEQKVDHLKRLHQELADVGCELKDLSGGLVDFPAMFEGRKVLLCWKLGEPEVAYWHELRAGFAGRRPIDAEFRLRAREPTAVETERIGPA
ncbi:MAG: DUF2203 domain-containing protein [Phycisphaerae bacterium]